MKSDAASPALGISEFLCDSLRKYRFEVFFEIFILGSMHLGGFQGLFGQLPGFFRIFLEFVILLATFQIYYRYGVMYRF